MRTLRVLTVLLLLGLAAAFGTAMAQTNEPPVIRGKTGVDYDSTNNFLVITNGLFVKYTDAGVVTILTADRGRANVDSGDLYADGSVRLQRSLETWEGEHLYYNFKTRKMEGESFRMGQAPFYVAGEKLNGVGEGTNGTYHTTNSIVTTDDYYNPLLKVHAKEFTIVPGDYVEAHDATLYAGKVPIFYFPYYKRSLVNNGDGFTFLPGYRSRFGPYLLSTYTWTIDEHLRAQAHLDYRERRGFGEGPELDFNYGDWGKGTASYYYSRDHLPGVDPNTGVAIPRNRQRAYFADNSMPMTNLTIISQVAYQTDPFIVRDFFESQYRKDIQPSTFFDVNKGWQNWSLDAMAQPRINPFWETVERLPEVRLNGFRQQIGSTPLYYESQSTLGYYDRLYANTNLPIVGPPPMAVPGDYWGSRADTFHQITLPETFFGWLNVTPRAGGRFTYYGNDGGPGGTNSSHHREVFNTGMEASFTMSRVWAGAESQLLDVDGIRHIMQPSANYVYIPRPNALPGELPQYDYELTNLRLLPLDFPQYNSIDSINSQNTIRWGFNNRIQTKRNGEVQDLLSWDLNIDWHLRPRPDQTTFSDIYSDLTFKPRSWLSFSSFTRYSIEQDQFNLAQHTVTIQPNNTWNWSVGHLYLRQGPIFGIGDNLFTSIFFYRLNENWGTRVAHYFDANHGVLQEQDYTIYHDLRSWTAALTFRALNNLGNGKDYGVAFTFSFKSFPRYGLGSDSVRSAPLMGY